MNTIWVRLLGNILTSSVSWDCTVALTSLPPWVTNALWPKKKYFFKNNFSNLFFTWSIFFIYIFLNKKRELDGYVSIYVMFDIYATRKSTVCPRNLDPSYIVIYEINWVKTWPVSKLSISVVLILDGSSGHFAHGWKKIGIFGE